MRVTHPFPFSKTHSSCPPNLCEWLRWWNLSNEEIVGLPNWWFTTQTVRFNFMLLLPVVLIHVWWDKHNIWGFWVWLKRKLKRSYLVKMGNFCTLCSHTKMTIPIRQIRIFVFRKRNPFEAVLHVLFSIISAQYNNIRLISNFVYLLGSHWWKWCLKFMDRSSIALVYMCSAKVNHITRDLFREPKTTFNSYLPWPLTWIKLNLER